jgi:hypothetical protein
MMENLVFEPAFKSPFPLGWQELQAFFPPAKFGFSKSVFPLSAALWLMAKATENVRISATIGTITVIVFLFMVSAPIYLV